MHQVGQHGALKSTMLALSRHQFAILKKCEKESSINDLMLLSDRKDRTKFRNSLLKPLLDAGFIEMTIPDKPRSSKQKYRITDQGRDFIVSAICPEHD
ncbi:MAG: ATP-dependent DNA helicase [Desulfobacterales bacterium]|nr:ATP-dependent DNA helicase [Desulfobacterales bacterium]